MPYYAALIHGKCGLVDSVWGFIDGTLRKICRPTYFQKQAYSEHKRSHGIKFQSVVTPDGLFALMFGPIMGNRHDSYMLAKSELIPKLTEFMPQENDPVPLHENAPPPPLVFSLYGDPAYPQSGYIFGGYRNPRAGSSPEAQWNTEMSKVREVVEWGFANIIANWAFLNFKPAMMIFKSPIAKYYIVGAFLANLRTCFYGNQTMAYFGADAMSLDEYLSLID
jgi:nuclease HARBI1